MKLALEKIRLDGGTQPRESLNPECIIKYAADFRAGVEYDPIEIVHDGSHYWCWDGFHRCHAAKKAGLAEIEANVTPGTLDDARWLSFGANKKHGLPRNNRDKAKAVREAMKHPNGAGLSDNQIARHVGVSQPFVGKIRKQLAATYNRYKSSVRTGRDGRTINTAKIGKRPSKPWKSNGRKTATSQVYTPIRGHSKPLRMIPLQFCPENPHTAAATLIELFPQSFLEALVQELTQHLQQQGAES